MTEKRMDFKKKTPCSNCPFLEDSKKHGFGNLSPGEFINQVWNGEMKISCLDDPQSHCAGVLIMMRKGAKLPRDPEVSAAVQSTELDLNAKTFKFPAEFAQHHMKQIRGKVL